MAEHIYDPLERFRDEYFPKFKTEVREVIENIVKTSGVDVGANSKLCDEIYVIQKRLDKVNSVISVIKGFRTFFRVAMVCGFLSFILVPFVTETLAIEMTDEQYKIGSIIGAGVGVLCALISIIFFNPAIKKRKRLASTIQTLLTGKKDTAWKQLGPVFSLFTWDMTINMIRKVVPVLNFDRYFSEDRYNELNDDFGPVFGTGQDTSTLGLQSGVIEGNPFVFVRRKLFHMGTKVYTGTKTISWTEYTYVNGKQQSVRKSETLTATVTKPFPEYSRDVILLYGNDAAPNLTFTKRPSEINRSEGGSERRKLKRKIKLLEKFSRNLTDDSDYTIMTNKEFEARFDTTDRNDETQFRLLFTALAQRQMMSILVDKTVGYGDDFEFHKRRKMNLIKSEHLAGLSLDTDPSVFKHFDIRRVKELFIQTNEEYFRGIYFAFAPLLAIPLYQQTKSHKTIWGDDKVRKSTHWEWELMANFRGSDVLKPKSCATETIIKTGNRREREDGTTVVDVHSYGFSSHPRCTHVSVFGGDGRYHDVPVHWDEYLPVSMVKDMIVKELSAEEAKNYTDYGVRGRSSLFYRNIYSQVLD